MAFIHGKSSSVLFASTDLSAYLNSWDTTLTADTAEVTCFGNGSKAYIAGGKDATVSLSGFFDGSASAVDSVLATAIGGTRVLTLSEAGVGTIGNRALVGQAIHTSYQVSAPVGDAVTISAEAQVTGGMASGVVLADLTARTAAGNTTAVDNAASSANGAMANVHLTAFTGTNITVKVQHSADNSTWVDLITFTQLTAAGSENKTVTGTVNRYLRVNLSGTFTSATLAVAAARL